MLCLALAGGTAVIWLPRIFPGLRGDIGFIVQIMIGLMVLGAFCLHLSLSI